MRPWTQEPQRGNGGARRVSAAQLDLLDFPPTGGHNPPTSFDAAERIRPRTARLRDRIEAFVLDQGARGSTREEAEMALDIKTQTITPRLHELQKRYKQIIVHGRRKNRSGASAGVYVHVKFSEQIASKKDPKSD